MESVMDTLSCPYCGQEKKDVDAREFSRCRFCGFRSALVDSPKSGRLLIVDRRMPFLQRRCEDLASQLDGVTVVVDRRVAQDTIGNPERRVNGYGEMLERSRRQPPKRDSAPSSPEISPL